MFIQLVVLEVALLALASLLIPIGVRWGMAPLTRLRREHGRRSASDFTPLPLADVPRELRDLVTTFNALLARLDGAVEGMRRFTADASHQMRTPLSILRTHISVLKMSQIEESARDGIDRRHRDGDGSTATTADSTTGAGACRRRRTFGPRLARPSISAPRLARLPKNMRCPRCEAGVDLHLSQEDASRCLAHARQGPGHAKCSSNLVDNAVRYNHARRQRHGSRRRRGPGSSRPSTSKTTVPAFPKASVTRCSRASIACIEIKSRPGSGLGLSIVQVLAQILDAKVALSAGAGWQGSARPGDFSASSPLPLPGRA